MGVTDVSVRALAAVLLDRRRLVGGLGIDHLQRDRTLLDRVAGLPDGRERTPADAPVQLWIPEGFGHGFLVLSESADVLYKTTDYGATWGQITKGIEDDHFTRVIRADPDRAGLLYAGTERGAYVSFDDGGVSITISDGSIASARRSAS